MYCGYMGYNVLAYCVSVCTAGVWSYSGVRGGGYPFGGVLSDTYPDVSDHVNRPLARTASTIGHLAPVALVGGARCVTVQRRALSCTSCRCSSDECILGSLAAARNVVK